MLLLLVLVAVNIVSFMKLPKPFVTNDAAFTELADDSKRYLSSLDRPVHVYLIMPENYSEQLGPRESDIYKNLYADCRGFLVQCEDHSRKFKATFLSPGFDDTRIAALMDRLKITQADRDQFGMLAVVGENEEATAFIRANDLIAVDRRQLVFQGENRLLTELMYLTDARAKEKIYFTQGHGELSMEEGAERDKSASGAVQFLRDRKLNVERLELDEPGAKVPEDAAVVVIAGLRRSLTADDPMIVALRNYLSRPEKSGKLLVCLPAFRNPQGRVGASGLESLLAEFGVEVDSTHKLLGYPGKPDPPEYVQVGPVQVEGRIARVIQELQLILKDVRPIQPGPNAGTFRVTPILATFKTTWREDDLLRSPTLTISELGRDPQFRVAKRYSTSPTSVAVSVSETTTVAGKPVTKSRMIVLGTETFLQDSSPVSVGAEEFRQQFFSDSIEWLKERDANIGIPPRKLGIFILDKPIESSSQIMLMALVTVGIVAFGVSVWLSRRR